MSDRHIHWQRVEDPLPAGTTVVKVLDHALRPVGVGTNAEEWILLELAESSSQTVSDTFTGKDAGSVHAACEYGYSGGERYRCFCSACRAASVPTRIVWKFKADWPIRFCRHGWRWGWLGNGWNALQLGKVNIWFASGPSPRARSRAWRRRV